MAHKSNQNIVCSCKYHVVWCPKHRRKVLVKEIDIRLKELLQAACKEIDAAVIAMEIMPDHVHWLIEVDPQYGIHKTIQRIKGKTSRILRHEHAELRTRLPAL
ncbi:MAG: IS200/IS605 family transposase [Clostridiaceae bacterium]|nr:IS200/IS605 family transposase [Clostridiaceae bacterium]